MTWPPEPDWNPERVIDRLEERFGEWEPRIHAFVEEPRRFERLRGEARELADRFPDPSTRPPLFGLLLGVKDIFNVEGLETRAGSTLPAEEFAGPEAPCVTALREAGALVVGKTVTTEFAFLANGPTRNPHDLEHTPGGSSSGSAAAVAAGLCDAALGTQTVGSLMRPAAFCGINAMKPSKGRIDDRGIVALAPTLDHVGCLGGNLEVTEAVIGTMVADWTPVESVKRPTLGLPSEDYLRHAEDSARTHFGMVCTLLESMGFTLIETDALAAFESLHEAHMDLCAIEAAEVHRDWRSRYEQEYDPRTIALLDRAEEVDESRRTIALKHPGQLRTQLAEHREQHGIDLWIAPGATGPAPLGIESTGSGLLNGPWTGAGLPTVSLPAGRTADGLPMGVQVIGGFNRDEATLAQARRLEPVLNTP
ncbi:MAG: amidase [Planctomycetota bacterium]|nr:amidase [Planctomycetota bacterium]